MLLLIAKLVVGIYVLANTDEFKNGIMKTYENIWTNADRGPMGLLESGVCRIFFILFSFLDLLIFFLNYLRSYNAVEILAPEIMEQIYLFHVVPRQNPVFVHLAITSNWVVVKELQK